MNRSEFLKGRLKATAQSLVQRQKEKYIKDVNSAPLPMKVCELMKYSRKMDEAFILHSHLSTNVYR